MPSTPPKLAIAAALATLMLATPALAACPGNEQALGVARTVQIDTAGGPRFGFQHYKVHDFLQSKEVVLTFDDGPLPQHTRRVLKALAKHCTKATFFPVGKLAVGYPEVLREIAKAGHTIGTHTWSHKNLAKRKTKGIDEIEMGLSAVTRANGTPIAPFFRFPYLRDSSALLTHLSKRNLAVFSTDVDTFDFKYRPRSAKKMITKLLVRLEKNGSKGIILMHDIQPVTSHALPSLLKALYLKGYKVVHLTAAGPAETLAKYDKIIEPKIKGLPPRGSERPTSSVVRTVPTKP